MGIFSSGHLRYIMSASIKCQATMRYDTYSTKLITLNLLLFPASEAALVDQLGQFLLHKLINLLDSLLESFLRGTGNMQVQRWVLYAFS